MWYPPTHWKLCKQQGGGSCEYQCSSMNILFDCQCSCPCRAGTKADCASLWSLKKKLSTVKMHWSWYFNLLFWLPRLNLRGSDKFFLLHDTLVFGGPLIHSLSTLCSNFNQNMGLGAWYMVGAWYVLNGIYMRMPAEITAHAATLVASQWHYRIYSNKMQAN